MVLERDRGCTIPIGSSARCSIVNPTFAASAAGSQPQNRPTSSTTPWFALIGGDSPSQPTTIPTLTLMYWNAGPGRCQQSRPDDASFLTAAELAKFVRSGAVRSGSACAQFGVTVGELAFFSTASRGGEMRADSYYLSLLNADADRASLRHAGAVGGKHRRHAAS
jgi:hypothetical protein